MATRLTYILALALVLTTALILRIWDPNALAHSRLLIFDSYQQISPRIYDPKSPVRIIDIDEASIERIGQWPWPRTVLADLVQNLNQLGAAVIAFDIVFSERDRLSPEQLVQQWPKSSALENLRSELGKLPAHDEVFAKSLADGAVIMGFIAHDHQSEKLPLTKSGFAFAGDDPKLFAPSYLGATVSLFSLQEKASGIAALNWIPEHDQIIRRLPMIVRIGETLYPSLSLESLRLAQGASTLLIKSSGASNEHSFGAKTGINHLRVGNIIVPTDAKGQMWLKFTKTDARRYISAWKILKNEIPQNEIEGRIVLIGTSAAGLFDLRTTPLETSVPGVEIHAQAIEQMVSGEFLQRPDFAAAAEIFYMLALGIAVGAIIYLAGAFWSAFIVISAIAGVAAASWFSYTKFGWLVDPIYPSFAILAVYISGTLYVYLRTEAERNRVRNAFSHYMAPALVEELASSPDKLKLGGEMRELTLLFCDVRGFTAISENLDAESLTRFINNLFTPLTDIILEARGTIDKYMGDAIMAFWNAPLDDPAHPTNACRAALAIMGRIEELNKVWKQEAKLQGHAYHPVQLGIGINSGLCCVGNLGSEQRFDYSVIGDSVNIASRLEGQTKAYGVKIIIGETTAAHISNFASLEIDRLQVKGKKEPVRIFALMGDEATARTTAFIELNKKHNAMLAAYRARQWDDADKQLEACQALGEKELIQIYDLYAKRINDFRAHPPPEDWDGRAVAETK